MRDYQLKQRIKEIEKHIRSEDLILNSIRAAQLMGKKGNMGYDGKRAECFESWTFNSRQTDFFIQYIRGKPEGQYSGIRAQIKVENADKLVLLTKMGYCYTKLEERLPDVGDDWVVYEYHSGSWEGELPRLLEDYGARKHQRAIKRTPVVPAEVERDFLKRFG